MLVEQGHWLTTVPPWREHTKYRTRVLPAKWQFLRINDKIFTKNIYASICECASVIFCLPQWKVLVSQVTVILSPTGLMAIRSWLRRDRYACYWNAFLPSCRDFLHNSFLFRKIPSRQTSHVALRSIHTVRQFQKNTTSALRYINGCPVEIVDASVRVNRSICCHRNHCLRQE